VAPKSIAPSDAGSISASNLPVGVIVSLEALPKFTSPSAFKTPPIVVIPEIDAPPCLCRVIPAPTPMFIVLAKVVPSNVKLPLSSNSPPDPARTTLPEVKS